MIKASLTQLSIMLSIDCIYKGCNCKLRYTKNGRNRFAIGVSTHC